MDNTQKNRGITLIALIITIIVLLILAGIAIAALAGDNGIITQARNAKNKHNAGQEDEEQKLGDIHDIINEIEEEMEVAEVIYKEGVPIPGGFYYVGGTIDSGLVISDDKNDENKGDSHSVAGNLKGNQFVWVPVPNIDEIYDKETKTARLYWFYDNRVSQEMSAEAKKNYIEPGVVYKYEEWDEEAEEYKEIYTYDAILENLEVAGVNITGLTDGEEAAEVFETQLQNEFNAMINSVGKYKGFYIGRYETGNLSQSKVVSQKNNTDISSQTWYAMYKKQKDLYKNKKSVESSMIWGCQWDATLRWINKNESVGNYVCHSLARGNYTSELLSSGKSEGYKVNNLYDMAGNVWECTIESYSEYRCRRGGGISEDTGWYTVCIRMAQSPDRALTALGSRLTLYIK